MTYKNRIQLVIHKSILNVDLWDIIKLQVYYPWTLLYPQIDTKSKCAILFSVKDDSSSYG